MNESLIWIIVFVVSLGALLQSSHFFTKSADTIGVYFGVPEFIVGVTIIAVGTSLPELVSSIFAVVSGNSEIVVGNVVGSNITNICLIVGLSAVMGKRLTTTYDLAQVDLPLLLGSALLISFMIWDGKFGRIEAVICLVGIGIYMFYAVGVERKVYEGEEGSAPRPKLGWKTPLVLVLSAIALYFSAKYTVRSIVRISEIFSIAKETIAVTAVSLGTSLPELAVSIMAARNGKPGLAIGNVLGSNIFNSFAVMGIPALFGTILIPRGMLEFAVPLMLAVTILFVFMSQDKVLTRWDGWLFLLFYCFFIGAVLHLI